MARHASSHAAGVIISDKPLVQYVPLHRPTSGEAGLGGIRSISQWPMEIIEKIGLLKVDFLGLSTLTVMRLAAQLIEQRHGVRYTMDNIPYDIGQCGPDKDSDKGMDKAFAMLGRGDVLGVFQVEGSGMRKLMMDMKPRRFDHIIAAISLFRPGPMENIPEYIRRMHAALNDGKDVAVYHTPELKPILQDTYGILVYQEQIIRIAAELAGYEPGEADMIRKAVSKKKRDLMDEHKAQFTAGAMARGFSREVCDAIWFDIEFFARYGFNKAHAADYAVICCQTAYLKAHYPVEYLTALLSVDRHDTEKVAKYVTDARRLGINVAPPVVNRAMLDFTIEDGEEEQGSRGERERGRKNRTAGAPVTPAPLHPRSPAPRSTIRYGLAAIKNAGEGAVQLLIDERQANGSFRDPVDLAERVDLRRVGKRALESMARVGVFDEWGSRACVLDALDRLVGHSAATHAAAEAGQMTLFGGGNGHGHKIDVSLLRAEKDVKAIDRRELLDWEKELIGVYLTEHPLEHRLADLQGVVTARSGELDAAWNGKAITMAGLVAGLRTLNTKKGQPMAFVTLEDLDGKVDLVMFPKVWAAHREVVQANQIIVVRGTVQVSGEAISILANSVQTKLTIAHDAAHARALPPPPDDFDFWPPFEEQGGRGAGEQGRTSLSLGERLGEGSSSRPPTVALSEPVPAYVPDPTAAIPPPPDDDDEDNYLDYEATADEDAPTRPDPAAVAEAQEPLPPPVVTMPEIITNYELRITNEEKAANGRPMTADERPPTTDERRMTVDQPPPADDYEPPTNGLSRLLIVEIRASGNWKEACRQTLKLAGRFEGNAMLRLLLAGQDLVMDFPNHRVGSAVELIEQLERLPGVGRVYER